MSKIKAVLFDLDGTLVNTITDLAGSANYALKAHGFEPHEENEYKYFVGNGIAKMIERALPDTARDEKTLSAVLATFVEHYGDHSMDTTAPYDGIIALLDAVRARNIKTAVVTNKIDSAAKAIVHDFFGDRFDAVIGQTDGVPVKPDKAMPVKAMAMLGVTPDDCVFIGDSCVDVQTGVNCGAYPVGVLWGFREKNELVSNGAATVISKPDELLQVISDLDETGE